MITESRKDLRRFQLFTKKIVLMKIHEYANEVICIYNAKSKGNVLAVILVPALSIYVEHRLILSFPNIL